MINKIKEKINKSKKGFTLVELLAVIVILAVIMIITIPTVLVNMKKAKQNTFNTIGETMIKYLESNYNNCKIGNGTLDYDTGIFNEKCEIRNNITRDDLSKILIENTGYNNYDLDKVEIRKLDSGGFGAIVYSKKEGQFNDVETFMKGIFKGECWTLESINDKEYKLIEFHGINNDGTIVEACKDTYVSKEGNFYSVTIPSTYLDKKITTLGKFLFINLNFENITLEDLAAFGNNLYIKEITITEGISTIEDGTIVEDVNGENISIGTFASAGFNFFTKQVIVSDGVKFNLPDSLNYIGDYSFIYSYLKEINIPQNVKVIGNTAFFSNQLQKITIPENVEVIRYGAFSNNKNLTTVNFELSDNQISKLKIIGDSAFYESDIRALNIPSSVEKIGNNAFYKNNNLTTLNFKGLNDKTNQLKTIGENAFSYSNLDYQTEDNPLHIPEKVNYIGNNAFNNNNNLNYIYFGGSEIGFGANWKGNAEIIK